MPGPILLACYIHDYACLVFYVLKKKTSHILLSFSFQQRCLLHQWLQQYILTIEFIDARDPTLSGRILFLDPFCSRVMLLICYMHGYISLDSYALDKELSYTPGFHIYSVPAGSPLHETITFEQLRCMF